MTFKPQEEGECDEHVHVHHPAVEEEETDDSGDGSEPGSVPDPPH